MDLDGNCMEDAGYKIGLEDMSSDSVPIFLAWFVMLKTQMSLERWFYINFIVMVFPPNPGNCSLGQVIRIFCWK